MVLLEGNGGADTMQLNYAGVTFGPGAPFDLRQEAGAGADLVKVVLNEVIVEADEPRRRPLESTVMTLGGAGDDTILHSQALYSLHRRVKLRRFDTSTRFGGDLKLPSVAHTDGGGRTNLPSGFSKTLPGTAVHLPFIQRLTASCVRLSMQTNRRPLVSFTLIG